MKVGSTGSDLKGTAVIKDKDGNIKGEFSFTTEQQKDNKELKTPEEK